MEWNNWVLSWFKSITTDSHVFTVYLVSLTVAMSKMLPSVPDLSGSQPENTAGRDAAPSRARTHACLPSLSRNTWKLGDWTVAMTLATRAIHDHIIAAFLLCRHANRLEPSRAHAQLGPVMPPQDKSHWECVWRGAQHDHSGANERAGSALRMSNDWQLAGLLTGISHKFAACSCPLFIGVNRSVSELHWFSRVLVPNVQII